MSNKNKQTLIYLTEQSLLPNIYEKTYFYNMIWERKDEKNLQNKNKLKNYVLYN